MSGNYYCCFGPFRGNVLAGSCLIAVFGILFSTFLISLFIFFKFYSVQEFDKILGQQIVDQINGTPLEFALVLFPFILPPLLLAHICLAVGLFFRLVPLLTFYLAIQAILLAYSFISQFIAALLLCLHLFQGQYFGLPISILLTLLIFSLFLLTNAIPIWAFSIVCRARKCVKNRRDIEKLRKSTFYAKEEIGGNGNQIAIENMDSGELDSESDGDF